MELGSYFWHVQARDAAGNWSDWSSPRSITILPLIPTAPIPVSPANGYYLNDNTPTFSWTGVNGGNKYHIQIDNDSTFNNPEVDYITPDISIYYTPDLPFVDSIYYWRVQALNSMEENGPWCSTQSFTIDTVPPPPPSLSLPADAIPNLRSIPTFSWISSTGANAYQLLIDENSSFISPFYATPDGSSSFPGTPITSTSFTPSSLPKLIYFYWCVKARDAAGNWSPCSTSRTFTILPQIPAAPSLIFPANGSTTIFHTIDFKWTSVTDGTLYRLQVDNLPSFTNPKIDVEITGKSNYSVIDTLLNGIYYWRVQAKNDTGDWGLWSPVFFFSYSLTPPNQPILEAPENNSSVKTTPKFYWLEPIFAEAYEFQYDDDVTFTSPLYTSPELDEFSFTPPDIPVGKYYWHVRARDAAGNWGNWSMTFSFTMDTTAPSAPVLNYPADLTFTSDTTPSLSVKPVTDAVRYRYQVSSVEDFSSTLVDSTVKTILFSPQSTQALDYGLYYWRASAFDSASNESAFSSPWRLFISNLSSPKDGVNLLDIDPTFTWLPVPDALEYQLQIDNDSDFSTLEIEQTQTSGTTFTSPALGSGLHFWRMRVNTTKGWSSWTPAWKFTITSPLPAAPTLASPQNGFLTNNQTPLLSWNNVENGHWYHIQIDNNIDFSSPEQDVLGNVGELTFTATEILEGKNYWRVSALNSDGNQGPWSSCRSLTIDITAPLPPVPSLPVNNAPNIRISPTFYWLASNTATHYRFEYDITEEIQTPLYSSPELTTLYHTPPTISFGTYFWHVQSRDAAGNWSNWSPSRAVSIIPPIPSKPVLVSPINKCSITSRSITFSWDHDENAANYQIMVDDSPSFTSPFIDEMTDVPSLSRDFTSSGLYYWRVQTRNSNGESGDWSAIYKFDLTIPPSTPPNPPENLNAIEITPVQLKLVWDDKSFDETSFVIERSRSGGQWEKIDSVNQDTATFVDTNLTCNTEYHYRVNAYNSVNSLYSAYSNEISIYTLPCQPVEPPVIPSSLRITAISNTTLDLAWQNTDSSVTSFHVEKSLDASSWEEVAEITVINSTYQVSGLSINTLYYFRIRAYREIDSQYSDYSEITSATTKATIFEDDFSTDMGWTDLSGGAIYRDTTNQWLEWSASRDTTHRYYIPIQATPGFIRLDFRFYASSFNGNGSVAFGLAENLDAPTQAIEVDATGFFTRIFRYDWNNWVHPLVIYQDGTSYSTPIENWLNFQNLNTWYKIRIEINQNNWHYVLMDDSGNPLSQLSGTLTQQHSRYNYLLVVFDTVGGWESASGRLDDIQVYDLASQATLSGIEGGTNLIPLEKTPTPTPSFELTPTPLPTLAPELSSPSNLSISLIDQNSVLLNWDGYPEANNSLIQVERSSGSQDNWSVIGTIAATNMQFIDPNILCDSRYFYRIYAVDIENGFISPFSNEVTIEIPSCTPAPTITEESPMPINTLETPSPVPTIVDTPFPPDISTPIPETQIN